MTITKIQITSMAKFENFATELTAIVLIQGRNEQGKTSFLDCIRYAFGRGHDPDMINAKADQGEILITFDDGGQVKCRANREQCTTTRAYRAPGTKKFLVSREAIDAITNAISYNPIQFLDLKDRDQVETILKIMPVDVAPDELTQAIGEAFDQGVELPVKGNAFDRIGTAVDTIYELRRQRNVAADTSLKHAGELEQAIGEADATDWEREEKRLRGAGVQKDTAMRAELKAVENALEARKETIRKSYEESLAALQKERDEFIEAELEAHGKACEGIRDKYEPELRTIAESIATAAERAKLQQRSEGTRQAAVIARQEAAVSQRLSAVLSESLTRLAALKATVVSRLPISNVDIKEGRIFNSEGVAFGRWNTASQLQFCLRLAVLAHGKAGFICLDGAERFDSQKRKALIAAAQKYAEQDGLQFVIATVTDDDFTIADGGK